MGKKRCWEVHRLAAGQTSPVRGTRTSLGHHTPTHPLNPPQGPQTSSVTGSSRCCPVAPQSPQWTQCRMPRGPSTKASATNPRSSVLGWRSPIGTMGTMGTVGTRCSALLCKRSRAAQAAPYLCMLVSAKCPGHHSTRYPTASSPRKRMLQHCQRSALTSYRMRWRDLRTGQWEKAEC